MLKKRQLFFQKD